MGLGLIWLDVIQPRFAFCGTYIRGKGAGLDNLLHCFDYYSIFKLDEINLIIKCYFNDVILLFLPNLRQLGLLS